MPAMRLAVPKEPQGQGPFFHVEFWHVCGVAALVLALLAVTARNVLFLHVSLQSDLIEVAGAVLLLAIYIWRYRAQGT